MLRVGVIGIQGYGRASLSALAERGDTVVTALCDLDAAATRRIAQARGIAHVFTDYRELLSSDTIDAVIIATPHFLHHPMTLAALALGKHVFCEKPLAITASEADEMAAAAEKAGRVLTCHYNQRAAPHIQALRNLVARGEMGDCYHVHARWLARWTGFMFSASSQWRTDPEKAGGGIFIGRGSHLIDAVWYLLGEPRVQAVHAVVQNRLTGFAVEDYASATLYLKGGATVSIECSYALSTPAFREKMEIAVYGTRGGAAYSKQDNDESVWQAGHLDLSTGAWQETPFVAPSTASPTILDNFVDAVLRDTPLLVTAHSAAFVTKILAAGYESARTQTVVSL